MLKLCLDWGKGSSGNPDVVVDRKGARLEIVYRIHLIENTRFLEDLFWKTKGLRALQGCRIRGVAYTLG